MSVNTSSTLSNSIMAKYIADYVEGAVFNSVYDQFAAQLVAPNGYTGHGSSVSAPFMSRLAPSSQTISESADLVSVGFRDTTVSVSWTSRGNAVQVSEKLDLANYTDATARMFKELGKNAEESIEQLAIAILTQNGLNLSTQTTRSSVDAGTATHRLARANFIKASTMLSAQQVPQFITPGGGRWVAAMHPYVFADLIQDTDVKAVGQYQQGEIVLNNVLGEFGGFALVVSPFAKAFWGAGAANASAVNTTLSGAENALDTVIAVASATNIAVGKTLTIGTVESSTTLYPDTELVTVVGISGTDITIAGTGPNGGLKYDHAAGATVKNTDNVFPVIFGCPESIAKIYDPSTGPKGKMLPPEPDGKAKQFINMAWKWYGNYGVISNARWVRMEVSSSMDA